MLSGDFGLIFARLHGEHRAKRSGQLLARSYVLSSMDADAPLAQSAERFHGKEKVDSSILSGGSVLLYGLMSGRE